MAGLILLLAMVPSASVDEGAGTARFPGGDGTSVPSPAEGPRSPRIAALLAALERGEADAVSRFWDEVAGTGTPLVEPVLDDPAGAVVTFLWRGGDETRNVVVFSGVTMMWGFSRGDLVEHRMDRIAGTDVWYRTYLLPSDTRFAYYLSPDDSLVPSDEIDDYAAWERRSATWRADPLNPRRQVRPHADGEWVVSITELPGAPPKPWGSFEPVHRGVLEERWIESAVLGEARRVWVYLPPGYAGSPGDHPLMVSFDGSPGSWYGNPDSLDRIVEYLAAQGRIEPPVIVSVEQQSREEELGCSDTWNRFLVGELVPWIRRGHRVTTDPRRVVVAGGSLGGLAALYAALEHPEVFGNVLSTSGFVSWKSDADYGRIMRRYALSPRLPLRFYLDVGIFERDVDVLLYANRHLRDVLVAKGYEVHYREFSGGHDSTHTAIGLADGLQALLPPLPERFVGQRSPLASPGRRSRLE